jgi:hypothetical protein
MRYAFLLALIAGFLFSCERSTNENQVQLLGTESPYKICSLSQLPEGVSLNVSLDTSAHNQLNFFVQLPEKPNKVYKLLPEETELLVADSRTYPPRKVAPLADTLVNNKGYQLSFAPVNNGLLNHRIGLAGDYLQTYAIVLKSVYHQKERTDTVQFCMDEQVYRAYHEQRKSYQPQIYIAQPSANAQQEQQAYWIKHTGEPGTAQFSENEYFVGGINMRHTLYQVGDSLFLRLKLVNHSPEAIYIKPAEIKTTAPDGVLVPTSLPAADSVVMRKGERWQGQWVYFRITPTDSISVDYSGIRLFTHNMPWLKVPVWYNKVN